MKFDALLKKSAAAAAGIFNFLIMSDPERVDRLIASGKFEAAAAMAAQILQRGGQQHPDVAAKLLSRRSEVRISEPLTALCDLKKNPENPAHPREDVNVLSQGACQCVTQSASSVFRLRVGDD